MRFLPFFSRTYLSDWVRKASKQDLEQLEPQQYFQLVTEAVPEIIWTVTPEGMIDFTNSRFKELVGAVVVSTWGFPWENFIHPEDQPKTQLEWEQCFKTGKKFEVEHRLKRASDGHYVWHLSRAVPLTGSNGKILKWFGASTDIDKNKKLEQELRQSEERFKLAEEGSKVGIWDWDLSTNNFFHSAQLKSLVGFEHDDNIEPTFEFWMNLIHPSDRTKIVQSIQDYLDGKTSQYEVEHRIHHKDGHYRWILSRGFLTRDEKGKPKRFSGTNVDITSQKHAELQLKARNTLEAIVVQISNRLLHLPSRDIDRGLNESLAALGKGMRVDRAYVFLLQKDGNRLTYNHEWCDKGIPSNSAFFKELELKHFPYGLSQLQKGKPVVVNRPQDLPAEAYAEREIMKISSSQSTILMPMMYQENLIGILGLNAIQRQRVWDDDATNLLRVVSEIFVNAIQRAHAENILLEQTVVLARSNADLEQFAYISSHDLQEPLRTASIYLQLLKKKYGDKIDAEGSQYIELAVTSARRMQALIDDILTFSRSGRMELRRDEIDSNDIVHMALANLERSVQESKAQIQIKGLPKIHGDRFQLVQLFQNLISNALKYRGSACPQIKIMAHRLEQDVVFAISDNGIGIEERYFEKIFQIFQRLHPREDYLGTGIGLALAKKVVERHGGKIWVESEVGKGSTFYVMLPARMKKAA